MNSNLLSLLFAVIATFGAAGMVFAQDEDLVVRVVTEPSDSVFVGQRIAMSIDVLARDVWANLPGFSRFDVPGAIVLAPPNNAVRLSEQLRGDSFIGQRYEWWIYPQRPGKLVIPSLELDVELKEFGVGKVPSHKPAATDELSINVTYPEGVPAEAGLICTTDLEARQSWKPESGSLEVGDGIVRTITRTINDTPAMILSEITFGEISGVKSYGKQPDLEDRFNRGQVVGQRTDAVTYIFEQPGAVELPSVRVSWWDLEKKQLESIDLDGITLQIEPATETASSPTPSTSNEAAPPELDARVVLACLAALIAVAVVVFRYRAVISGRLQRWHDAVANSEHSYFRRFATAARSSDPRMTLQALMRWLDVANEHDVAPRLDQFLDRYGDAQAAEQLALLERAVDSQLESWDASQLVSSIQQARRRWLTSQRKRVTASRNPLPPHDLSAGRGKRPQQHEVS